MRERADRAILAQRNDGVAGEVAAVGQIAGAVREYQIVDAGSSSSSSASTQGKEKEVVRSEKADKRGRDSLNRSPRKERQKEKMSI